MMEAPRRCPSCGGEPQTVENAAGTKIAICCTRCSRETKFRKTYSEALELWNYGEFRQVNDLDELIRLREENARLMDYAADLRIAMRNALRALKLPADYALENELYTKIKKARKILKEGLKDR